MITYHLDPDLDLDAILACYRASGLGLRRPVDDRERMRRMLVHANVLVAACDGPRLVGIARAWSDFAHITYLADLCVDVAYQGRGIGRRLIAEVRSRSGPDCSITLLAAPDAAGYYGRVGFEPHPSAWYLPRNEPDPSTVSSSDSASPS